MKKLLISLAVLFVVIFSGVLIAPYFIPYDKISQTIEKRVEESIGVNIEILSAPTAQIFPQPSIAIKDIRILNPEGFSDQAFISLGALKASLNTSDLIKGQINIAGIRFIDPVINLEMNNDGVSNWDSIKATTSAGGDTTSTEETANTSDPNSTIKGAVTNRLNFDQIDVEGLIVRFKSGETEITSDKISADINFNQLSGPYRISLSTSYQSHKIDSVLDIGKYAPDAVIPLQAEIDIDNQKAQLSWLGNVTLGDNLSIDGKLKASAVQKWMGDLPQLKAEGDVIYDGTQFKINPLTVTFNDNVHSTLDNYITYDKDNGLKLGLRAVSFDLSKLLGLANTATSVETKPIKNDGLEKAEKQPKPTEIDIFTKLHQNSSHLGQKIDKIPNSDVAIQLGLLTFNDTLQLENVQGNVAINDGQATLSGMSFTVHQAASIEFDGDITPEATTIISQIKSDTVFLLTKSLGIDIKEDQIPAKAEFTATISSTEEKTHLSLKDVKLDNTSIDAVSFSIDPAEQPALSFSIENEGLLDLRSEAKESNPSASPSVTEKNSKSSSDIEDDVLGNIPDIQLAANIGTLITPQNIKLTSSEFSGTYKAGHIRDIKLSTEIPDYNSTVTLSGDSGDLSEDLNDLNLIANIKTSQFFDKSIKDIQSSLFIKGSLDKLDTSARIQNNALDIEWIGTVNDVEDASRDILGRYSMQIKDAKTILNALDIDKLYSDQPINVQGKFSLSKDSLKVDQSVLKQPGYIDLGFSLNKELKETSVLDLNLKGTTLKLKGGSEGGAISTEKTIVKKDKDGNAVIVEPEPLNLSILHDLQTNLSAYLDQFHYGDLVFKGLEADIIAEDGRLEINALSADAYDGRINIDGEIEAGRGNRAHEADLELSVRNINMKAFGEDMGLSALAGGEFSLNQKFKTQGLTVEQLIDNSNGQGEVNIKEPVFNGIDLDRLSQDIDRPNSPDDFIRLIKGLTAKGKTAFQDINMPVNLQYGTLSVQNILAPTKSETAILTGQAIASLSEKTAQVDVEVLFPGQRNLPPLGMIISGPFDNMQKSINTDNITRFFAQRATREIGRKLFGLDTPSNNTQQNGNAQPTTPLEDATRQIFDKLF